MFSSHLPRGADVFITTEKRTGTKNGTENKAGKWKRTLEECVWRLKMIEGGSGNSNLTIGHHRSWVWILASPMISHGELTRCNVHLWPTVVLFGDLRQNATKLKIKKVVANSLVSNIK
ncbi:hypothetical protein CBL_02385 [Carabus blaptoides fortunei]